MTKKSIYLFLVIILRVMLSFVVHVLAVARRGTWYPPTSPVYTWMQTLPDLIQLSILITGILVGYLIGQRRRTIVYIQKRHRSSNLRK